MARPAVFLVKVGPWLGSNFEILPPPPNKFLDLGGSLALVDFVGFGQEIFFRLEPKRITKLFPTTLWVCLTPWSQRFAVIAGFPLSALPWGNARLLLLHVFFLVGPLAWTPRLCLSKATFRSLTRFSPRNGILVFWLDPSSLLSKARLRSLRRFSPHNDILAFSWLDPSPLPFKGDFHLSVPPWGSMTLFSL